MKRKIVCLCGSTKFKDEYKRANMEETLRGNIVLSVGCYMHAEKIRINDAEKRNLDRLHLDKIEMADEILVINPNGYIGESTQSEIAYAKRRGKKIRYLFPQEAPE